MVLSPYAAFFCALSTSVIGQVVGSQVGGAGRRFAAPVGGCTIIGRSRLRGGIAGLSGLPFLWRLVGFASDPQPRDAAKEEWESSFTGLISRERWLDPRSL